MAIITTCATVRLPKSNVNLRDAEGCFVTVDANNIPALAAASATTPLGCIHVGGDVEDPTDIVLPNSGSIVTVKLHATPGTVAPGTKLVLAGNGTVKAGTSGTHVATAIKAGVANELVEAYLVPPTTLG